MIDQATGWIEIRTVPSARADLVANQVELDWLTSYPFFSKVIVNREYEVPVEFREMIINDYGIKTTSFTLRNPQANAIRERVHRTLSIILSTLKAQNMVLDYENP